MSKTTITPQLVLKIALITFFLINGLANAGVARENHSGGDVDLSKLGENE